MRGAFEQIAHGSAGRQLTRTDTHIRHKRQHICADNASQAKAETSKERVCGGTTRVPAAAAGQNERIFRLQLLAHAHKCPPKCLTRMPNKHRKHTCAYGKQLGHNGQLHQHSDAEDEITCPRVRGEKSVKMSATAT